MFQTYDKKVDWGVCLNSLPMWKDTMGSPAVGVLSVLFWRFRLRFAVLGFGLAIPDGSAIPLIVFIVSGRYCKNDPSYSVDYKGL